MAKFPIDAPRDRVMRVFECLGFRLVREGNHIAMSRDNPDGTSTPRTMPNHRTLKLESLVTTFSKLTTIEHISSLRSQSPSSN